MTAAIQLHNTEYVWDGAIGNTSAEQSGPTVHNGFWPMRDLAISGTNAFYVSGYNEGGFDFRSFATTDPQHVKSEWYWIYSASQKLVSSFSGDYNDLNWLWVAADSNRVYFACSGTPNPTNASPANSPVPDNYPGAIVSCNVADNSPAYFTNGGIITNNGPNFLLPNGIYVGAQPGLSGLSVQNNGNLLAAAVNPDNLIYLIDKVTGSAVGSVSVTSPGRLNFSPDGSLWVISGNNVICYTNLSTSPSIAVLIPDFSEPLDVAVDPMNPNLIIVADGGSRQQLKAYDKTGTVLWTYGLVGGYQVNGPAVSTNKFWFFNGENDGTFVSFVPDGSFWVGDGGNHRSLHFSAALNYLEQIMYQPFTWLSCVDQNNPSRVFNQFLEFNVDYAKPLSQAWTLVNNWGATVSSCYIPSTKHKGLREVTTFPNGRTYALIENHCATTNTLEELCELATNQLRLTGIFPMITTQGRWISLGADGSARATAFGDARWYESTLNGFDPNGNPLWNPESLIASAATNSTDPVPRTGGFGNIRTTISTNNILISFDQSLNNGWHLGGVAVGTSNWLWKVSPAVAYMNGLGTYEISNGVMYAGTVAQALDRQVIYGYAGENFRGEGQAAQMMHFYDDGLFVGQFGEASPGHRAYEFPLAAFAANSDCENLIKDCNGEYFLWLSDESNHGPQRWHFVNAKNICEQSGSGEIGSAITLTNPFCSFPVDVLVTNGNQAANLSWHPVAGATLYKVYYSCHNGGPYTFLEGSTTNCNLFVNGLANRQTYYAVVTAITGGVEGAPSEQCVIHPFDTSQNVFCVGSMTEGGQIPWTVQIDSNAPVLGLPSYIGDNHLTGLLDLRDLDDYGCGKLQNEFIGTKGYIICDWSSGHDFENIAGNCSFAPQNGWLEIQYLERQYSIDNGLTNSLGSNWGVMASPTASILISVTDTNYHYLTVGSPSRFDSPRNFTLTLQSTNGTSAVYTVNENPGYSHMFQFLFKGDVTLWADSLNSGSAIVQGLFLDDAPVTYSTSSSPATIEPPLLANVIMLGNQTLQFSFTNYSTTSFTVLASTNLLLPLKSWTVLGAPSNIAPGLFQFTSPAVTNDQQHFYLIRSP